MTRSELVAALAEKSKVSSELARHTVDLFFESISQQLASGGRVEIRGLGSFQVKHYKGYTGKNPKTRESVEVKPKILPVFRVGKELREALMRDPDSRS